MNTCEKCNKSVQDTQEICECGNWLRTSRAPISTPQQPEHIAPKRRGWFVANATAGIMTWMVYVNSHAFLLIENFNIPFLSLISIIASLIIGYQIADIFTKKLRPYPNDSTLGATILTVCIFIVGMLTMIVVMNFA